MDYDDRLINLTRHLEEHPTDYQAVIARIKIKSDKIEHEQYLRKTERLKKIAYYRRMLNEKR